MIVGIIAEYNPFHNGHRYQIEQIRKRVKNSSIIVVMSGNFTQRGEPAILDKFTRAELAVKGGCDLVLELPYVNVVRSAQDFARGGINLLKSLGIVEILAFGAEVDDIDLLKKIANVADTNEFCGKLHGKLKLGLSYANAVCQIFSEISGVDENLLKLPNVILAIEYIRALKKSTIQPMLIPRVLANFNDKQLYTNISSATAIRESIYSKNPQWEKISKNVDNNTIKFLKSSDLPTIERLFRPLLLKIICSTKEELQNIYGINEGLENKLIHSMHISKNFNEFVDCIVSQRYTRSRIQRLLLHLVVGLNKYQVVNFNDVHYSRILAFNQRGRELIKLIKQSSDIPVITKITQHINSRAMHESKDIIYIYQKKLKFDIVSSDIYSILKNNMTFGKDFVTSPSYINYPLSDSSL